MSFVWKRPEGRLKSPEQCAREILEVARELDLDELAAVFEVMCVAQESDFWCPWNRNDPSSHNYDFDSESNDGRSVGYQQAQNGRAGEVLPENDRDNWWGSMADRMDLKTMARRFFERLEDNYHDASNNPEHASEFISNVQRPRPDLRSAYAKHWSRAWQLVHDASTNQPAPQPEGNNVGFTGDPVWLEGILRDALGSRLAVEDGWAQRGVGGAMGDIWGVMIHHTGNSRETVAVIRDGRSDLQGPLSQCLITPDGTCHLIAVGPCNHAGIGDYGPLHDNGNTRLIGFECAWPDIAPDGSYNASQRWPDAQIITMRDAHRRGSQASRLPRRPRHRT
jgi:hypothetical protein